MEENALRHMMKNWGISFRKIRPDLPLAGSPERSFNRLVIEDDQGLLYVFETLLPGQGFRRDEISRTLALLNNRGIHEIQPYLPPLSQIEDGNSIISTNGVSCQLSPYIKGIELKRPQYIFDDWQGEAIGTFLVKMKKHASDGLPLKNTAPFSIFGFIDDLAEKMRRHNPAIAAETDDIVKFLNTDFRRRCNQTPVIFCHGDLHPLNVIWSGNAIRAVIDWEFMGMKPEFYDIANLLGCVGSEDPNGLVGKMVHRFLTTIYQARFLSLPSRKFLPEAVLALRLFWLSDWLRKKDMEMIDLELSYLRLLRNNLDDLRYSWGCE